MIEKKDNLPTSTAIKTIATTTKIPAVYLCPLSKEIMIEPVLAADGHTYQQSAIENWIKTKGNISPQTHDMLSHTSLMPNLIVKKLIETYIVENKSQFEKMALEAAMSSDIETLNILWKLGVNLETKDVDGRTLLYTAAKAGKLEAVQWLADKGAHINSVTHGKWSPLNCVCSYGNETLAAFLIDRGADIETPNSDNETPLHSATKKGNKIVVKLLLDHGAETNAKDANEWTPLHFAVAQGDKLIAEMLLENGANPDLTTKERWGCRDIAYQKQKHEMANVITNKNTELQRNAPNQVYRLLNKVKQQDVQIRKLSNEKEALAQKLLSTQQDIANLQNKVEGFYKIVQDQQVRIKTLEETSKTEDTNTIELKSHHEYQPTFHKRGGGATYQNRKT